MFLYLFKDSSRPEVPSACEQEMLLGALNSPSPGANLEPNKQAEPVCVKNKNDGTGSRSNQSKNNTAAAEQSREDDMGDSDHDSTSGSDSEVSLI